MQMSDILGPENVILRLVVRGKAEILRSLCQAAGVTLGKDDVGIHERSAVRERLASTGIGGGIALPHTLLAGLERPFGLLEHLIAVGAAEIARCARTGEILTLGSPVRSKARDVTSSGWISRVAKSRHGCLASLCSKTGSEQSAWRDGRNPHD